MSRLRRRFGGVDASRGAYAVALATESDVAIDDVEDDDPRRLRVVLDTLPARRLS